MACLGGTPEHPRKWIRVKVDFDQPVTGRICERQAPRTSLAYCFACPAFRGVDREGVLQEGISPAGDPIAFTEAEYELFQDDPEKFWLSKGEGIKWQTVAGAERRAAYMRGWRQRHPRSDPGAYERAKRNRQRRRKVIRRNPCTPENRPQVSPSDSHACERARDRASYESSPELKT